jgi:hypothetical protein
LRRAVRVNWPTPAERRFLIRDAIHPLIYQDARRAIAVAWVYIEADGANLRARREASRAAQGWQR